VQAENSELRSTLIQMLDGFKVSQAIAAGARLDIPDLLKDGPKRSDELAQRTGTQPTSLYRLLRTLSAAGILSENPGRQFSLTPLGELLRSNVPGSLHAMASHISTRGFWQRWGDLLERVRMGPIAAETVFVDRWQEDPEAAAIFNKWMTESSTRRAAAVLEGYDFAAIGTLVDVGGGQGQLLASILKVYPAMHGILFDLPHVIVGAEALLAAAGVADRCVRIGGSFFQSVPGGGDAYLLSVVIHDWDDERATSILKNCRAVMEKSSRLLLIERVVPTNSTPPLETLLADLNMLIGPGGMERTESEFASVLSAAGFRLTRIVALEPPFNVVEGVPA